MPKEPTRPCGISGGLNHHGLHERQHHRFLEAIERAPGCPPSSVVDGEALIWAHDRLDFNTLKHRMTISIKALPALVREHPVSFAAFDVLAVAGHDTKDPPLTVRPALLEELARTRLAPLNLSPATTDRDLARRWFEEMSAVGVEGIKAGTLGEAAATALSVLRISQ